MLPLSDQMVGSLGQALPLIVMCQEPVEFLNHFINIPKIDDSLPLPPENLSVFGGILNQHTRTNSRHLKSTHRVPISIGTPH